MKFLILLVAVASLASLSQGQKLVRASVPVNEVQESFINFRSNHIVKWTAQNLMKNVFEPEGLHGKYYLQDVHVAKTDVSDGVINFQATLDVVIQGENNEIQTRVCQVSIEDDVLRNTRKFLDTPICQ